MIIMKAMHSGFCPGVERAVSMAIDACSKYGKEKKIYACGELIHNKRFTEELSEMGIGTISETEVSESLPPLSDVVLLLRSHGVGRARKKELESAGAHLIDTKCPIVEKLFRTAREAVRDGRHLIVCGDRNHPEIRALLEDLDYASATVLKDDSNISLPKDNERGFAVVSQTTLGSDIFLSITEALKKRYDDVLVFNTICEHTLKRQEEIRVLCGKSDLIIIVGGRNSSNTTQLARIARHEGIRTLHIEDAGELDSCSIPKTSTVTIAGGASTPSKYLDEVADKLRNL